MLRAMTASNCSNLQLRVVLHANVFNSCARPAPRGETHVQGLTAAARRAKHSAPCRTGYCPSDSAQRCELALSMPLLCLPLALTAGRKRFKRADGAQCSATELAPRDL